MKEKSFTTHAVNTCKIYVWVDETIGTDGTWSSSYPLVFQVILASIVYNIQGQIQIDSHWCIGNFPIKL